MDRTEFDGVLKVVQETSEIIVCEKKAEAGTKTIIICAGGAHIDHESDHTLIIRVSGEASFGRRRRRGAGAPAREKRLLNEAQIDEILKKYGDDVTSKEKKGLWGEIAKNYSVHHLTARKQVTEAYINRKGSAGAKKDKK